MALVLLSCQAMCDLGDVADAVGADRQVVIIGEAGGHEEKAVSVDERGDVLLGRPFDDPDRFAVVGVVAVTMPRLPESTICVLPPASTINGAQ